MWCDAWTDGVAQGPVEAGFVDGDLGAAHRLCPQTSLGLAPTAYAIVEPENLYGRILATGTLTGSYALSDKVEVYANLEAFRFDTLIAAISVTGMGPGYTGVGASWRFAEGDHWGVGLQGKLVLPTAFTLDRHSWPLGADVGLHGAYALRDNLLVHGAAMPTFRAALGGGPAFPTFGVNLDVGVEWKPFKRFGFVLDSVSSFGRTEALDYTGAGVGFRGGIGEHAGLSLEARVPLAGRERALAAIDIRVNYRF